MSPSDLYTAIQADSQAALLAAAGNDAGCAVRMTSVLPTVAAPIPLGKVLTWAATNGVLPRINASAANTASPVQSFCLAIQLLFNGGSGSTLDITDSQVQAGITALVQAGVFTAAQQTSLLALGNTPQTVTPDEVSSAMLPHRQEWTA